MYWSTVVRMNEIGTFLLPPPPPIPPIPRSHRHDCIVTGFMVSERSIVCPPIVNGRLLGGIMWNQAGQG